MTAPGVLLSHVDLRPQSVLLTFFGDYVSGEHEVVATASLIGVLEAAGPGRAGLRAPDGARAGETLLTGFCSVPVPAGVTVEVTVPVTLEALGAWNPATKQLDPPELSAVVLEVGAHAHDPQASTVVPA